MDRLFRQWLDDHQDNAWSLARYLLRDRSEAEDVTQEAFIKLWQHRESIDPVRVKPWLMRVTRNICLDRLRRRRPEAPIDDSQLAITGGPLDSLEQSDTGLRLIAAIHALAEPFRSLVVLRDVQQHSYEDVAGVTGLSLPQVKTYLHRARKQLKEQLVDLR